MNVSFLFEEEAALIAYLDLANMFGWQSSLGWKFKIESLIFGLSHFPAIKEVRVYYGFDEKNALLSSILKNRIRKTGAILVSKPVKYIRKNLSQLFLVNQSNFNSLDISIQAEIRQFVERLKGKNIYIREPKCNFDVEMAMDMVSCVNRCSGAVLFSGDSDFFAPLNCLSLKGKKIYVCGIRKKVAAELFKVCHKYIDFGKLYRKIRSDKSKNPGKTGTA